MKLSELWPYFGRIIKKLFNKTKGMSMTGIIITIAIVVGAFTVGIASQYYMGDDNAVEEVAENIIEDQTGVNIDLSPKTKEKK